MTRTMLVRILVATAIAVTLVGAWLIVANNRSDPAAASSVYFH